MLNIPKGKKLIYHNGWWHGSRTVFIRLLDEDATIIALCNNDYKKIYSAKKLCNLFGDYRQGNENFEEGETDSGGRGGEPQQAQPGGPDQPAPQSTPPTPHKTRRRHRVPQN
jgi:hypothetical protein